MPKLDSFTRVDVSKLELDEPDDATSAMQGMLNGGELPEHMDMEQMMAGMGGMGGMAGDRMPALEGRDWDDYKVTAMEDADVGKTFDCTGGKGEMMKTLLEAGQRDDFDNPTDLWEATFTYTGRVAGSPTPFDASHSASPLSAAIGAAALPTHLERALRTMKRGERARFLFKPALAFGPAGDPERGVPGDADLEYEMALVGLAEVTKLAEGKITKKVVARPPRTQGSWELPEPISEISCRWKAERISTGQIVRPESQFRYSRADETLPALWLHVSMKRGEIAEYVVAAAWALGKGSANVDPEEEIKVTVTMEDWLNVEDASPARDRTALRVVRKRGQGWQKPLQRYECLIDFAVRVHPAPADTAVGDADPFPAGTATLAWSPPVLPGVGALASGEGVVVTVGGGAIEPALCAASVAAGCGEWGVGAALDVLLPLMQQGEEAELWCAPAFIGGPNLRVDVWARLLSWTRVEEVPETGGAVVRRVVAEAEDQYERPGEDAICQVRFTVRGAGGGDDTEGGTAGPGDAGGGPVLEATGADPREFILGDGSVLPCIDAAVREMKRGEQARITAPADWAYSAPGMPPPPAAVSSAGVVVLLELVDFVRGKDLWEMSVAEKARSQLRRKVLGNAAFARGQYERAVRLYEASNTRAPTEEDFDKEQAAKAAGGDVEGGKEGGEQGEPAGGGEEGVAAEGGAKEGKVEAGVAGEAAADEPAAAAPTDRASVQSTKLACFVNLAACHLKLGAASAADKCCTSALEISPGHAKALFRRGQARLSMAEFGPAKADLTAAAKADPTAREPRRALAELQAAVEKARREEKSAFGGIFK